jgi:hypothetical protein
MSNSALLTQAEVKELVAQFYRLVDLHAPAEDFISILAEEDLKMALAHGEINNFQGFKAWYDPLIRSFFDGIHKIYDVELVSTSDTEAKAKVVLVWDASVAAYPVVPGWPRCGMRGGMSRREGGEGAADGEGAIADRVPAGLP